MNLFLNAGAVFMVIGLCIVFMVAAILIKAGVMVLMKYHARFKKALLQSLLLNLASLAAGYVLIEAFNDFFGYHTIFSVFVLYLITVLIEFIFLQLLNRAKYSVFTLKVVAVMNVLTYLVLYFVGNN